MKRNDSTGGDTYWYWAKVTFGIMWLLAMAFKVKSVGHCLYPVGICRLYSFEPLFTTLVGKSLLLCAMAFSVWQYIREKNMITVLCMMFLLSVLIITYQESTGNFARATVYSTVLGAQLLAYILHARFMDFDLQKHRILFSVQMVAAGYTLAGIAKLRASGLEWAFRTPEFALQVFKNHFFLYADSGMDSHLERGQAIVSFLMSHPALSACMLGMALVLEAACLLVLIGGRTRVLWGIGLVLMHLGIAYVMRIGISAIAFPMVIFFINPIYWVANGLSAVRPERGGAGG